VVRRQQSAFLDWGMISRSHVMLRLVGWVLGEVGGPDKPRLARPPLVVAIRALDLIRSALSAAPRGVLLRKARRRTSSDAALSPGLLLGLRAIRFSLRIS